MSVLSELARMVTTKEYDIPVAFAERPDAADPFDFTAVIAPTNWQQTIQQAKAQRYSTAYGAGPAKIQYPNPVRKAWRRDAKLGAFTNVQLVGRFRYSFKAITGGKGRFGFVMRSDQGDFLVGSTTLHKLGFVPTRNVPLWDGYRLNAARFISPCQVY